MFKRGFKTEQLTREINKERLKISMVRPLCYCLHGNPFSTKNGTDKLSGSSADCKSLASWTKNKPAQHDKMLRRLA